MANKSNNFLFKLALIFLAVGAIYFALDHFLASRGPQESAPVTAAPSARPTTALTHEQAVQIGTEIGTRIGTEVGERVGKQIAADMLAQRSAEMATKPKKTSKAKQPAATVAQPAVTSPAETATMPTPEPAAAPAAATPVTPAPRHGHKKPVEAAAGAPSEAPAGTPSPAATEPKAETVAPTATESTTPAVPATETPPAEPVKPASPATETKPAASPAWWEQSLSDEPDALILKFAGPLKTADSSGIALLFSGKFDSTADFAGHITVKDANGKAVEGNWQPGENPGLVMLKGVGKGRYTVRLTTGLKDADGKTLKKDISGSVRVE